MPKNTIIVLLTLFLILQSGFSLAESYTDPVTGMEFVLIPGGCYKMGSSEGNNDEKPVHEACVDGFWMGKYEVTNAQYRRFRPEHDSRDYMGDSMDGDDQPAVYVSWEDAMEFAKWLSGKSSENYRLPTEKEWEYAARAGTTGDRYWSGPDTQACSHANVYDRSCAVKNKFNWPPFDCDDGYPVTAPVGSFKPNGFGLYDMLGNVWEWCSDRYDRKSYAGRSDKKEGLPALQRVLRGGSWFNAPASLRSSNRGRNTPDYRIGSVGFRLVRMEKQPKKESDNNSADDLK